MAPSPSRRTQSAERTALLPSDGNNRDSSELQPEAEIEGFRPSWQFWRRQSRHVSFAPTEDDEELPASTTTKRRDKRGWAQVALYAVLIVVGAVVGLVFSWGYDRRRSSHGLGDGPMVVPIFRWPPPVRRHDPTTLMGSLLDSLGTLHTS